jgi:hypothetical protein
MTKSKTKKRGFVDWLVRVLKPGYHVAKNPKTHTRTCKSEAGGLTGERGE